MTLLRQLIFLIGSLTVTFSYALLDLFFSSDASICSTIAFPPSRNYLHVFVSVSIDFTSNSKQDATLHHIADDYSRADSDSPCNYLRDVPWMEIFELRASDAASEFCESTLESMYMFPIVNIRSSLAHLHCF